MLLALLLGTALLFYLGGLLGQLLHNYEEWMRQGGMTGGIPMAEISTNEPILLYPKRPYSEWPKSDSLYLSWHRLCCPVYQAAQ